MKCHVLSCSGCGMSCFACAGFICCSRFGHGAVHSLRPLEGRMTAAGLLLPRLRGRPGGGRFRASGSGGRSPGRGPSRGEVRRAERPAPGPSRPAGGECAPDRPFNLDGARSTIRRRLRLRLRLLLRTRSFRPARSRSCHTGSGQGRGGRREPFGRHRRQFGAGVGCRHRSSLLRRGEGPFSARILRARPRLPGRAFAPARFARLIARARRRAYPSRRFLTGFQKAAPLGRATPEKRLRIPLLRGPSYHTPPDVKPKTRTKAILPYFIHIS